MTWNEAIRFASRPEQNHKPLPHGITPLRQRVLDDMRMRNLSPKTQGAYFRVVRQLTGFAGIACARDAWFGEAENEEAKRDKFRRRREGEAVEIAVAGGAASSVLSLQQNLRRLVIQFT